MSKLGSEFGSISGGKYDSNSAATTIDSEKNITLNQGQINGSESTPSPNSSKKGLYSIIIFILFIYILYL